MTEWRHIGISSFRFFSCCISLFLLGVFFQGLPFWPRLYIMNHYLCTRYVLPWYFLVWYNLLIVGILYSTKTSKRSIDLTAITSTYQLQGVPIHLPNISCSGPCRPDYLILWLTLTSFEKKRCRTTAPRRGKAGSLKCVDIMWLIY